MGMQQSTWLARPGRVILLGTPVTFQCPKKTYLDYKKQGSKAEAIDKREVLHVTGPTSISRSNPGMKDK